MNTKNIIIKLILIRVISASIWNINLNINKCWDTSNYTQTNIKPTQIQMNMW